MNKKFIPLAFAASLIFAACSDDQTDVVNNGPEITFRTSVSRAQNIDKTNLKEFKVWAFANVVSSENPPFIDGLVAKQDPNDTDVFKFDHSIFWPSDIATLNFWAISPAEGLTVNHSSTTMSLDNYEPAAQPEDQLDVITAFEQVTRGGNSGTSVQLTFNHILSQILVSAKAGDGVSESRSVKVKGAWLVNIGTNATASRSSESGANENKINWSACGSTSAVYGSYFKNEITLGKNALSFFDFKKDNVSAYKSNLLLIPQQLTEWDKTETGKGAYILLLCRVEATHTGKLHGTDPDPMVNTITENGVDKHVHQMFPHDGAATSFDPKAYGYACVPIGTNWETGKIYRYVLDICGKNSGAGIYPPVTLPTLPGLPDTPDIIIIPTPGADKVGDPVLDAPIQFKVSVSDWTDPEGWNSGVDLQ